MLLTRIKHLSLSTLMVVALGTTNACDSPTKPQSATPNYAINNETGELPECTASSNSPEHGVYNSKGHKINYNKEMLITNLDVVNDSCRTTWKYVDEQGKECIKGSNGHWTFGYLMSQLAGDTPAAQFIDDWVHTFLGPQTAEGITIAPRGNATLMSASPWGLGGFSPEKSPFRLLAIVNRVDLENIGAGYLGSSPQNPLGEARMVYGVLGPNGETLRAVVIFEFALPSLPNIPTATAWAAEWHKLNTLTGTAYKEHLQFLTDSFVNARGLGVGPNKGATIAQVRTNELAFDANMPAEWQMRSYTLQESTGQACSVLSTRCALKLSGLLNTPPKGLNGSEAFASFAYTNAQTILEQTHFVPFSYTYYSDAQKRQVTVGMHSAAVNLQGMNVSEVWQFPVDAKSSTDYKTLRQRFAFMTCNGCHYNETATTNLHIHERSQNQEATVSDFVRYRNLSDPKAYAIDDPGSSTAVASRLGFNEARRRACEMVRLLNGLALRFAPLNNATRY